MVIVDRSSSSRCGSPPPPDCSRATSVYSQAAPTMSSTLSWEMRTSLTLAAAPGCKSWLHPDRPSTPTSAKPTMA
ncbi:MAG: hypothetical protein WKF73_02620 [Nocardioidaceae bacterium]